MIPSKSAVAVTGSLPAAGRRMEFDAASIAHIMRILIDLYSDPEYAVIRELSTNAVDSHVMAGVSRPIDVWTPTPLSPYFKVKDTGLGLTVDELYALFGKYGASTKRDSNEAQGMLGLGSKSPLTYTNQFSLVAVKDGVRAVVSISRDEDGVGNLTVVDTAQTPDPNGVEITIPVKAYNTFESKARDFFQYWEPGTVLLNGKPPARYEGMEVATTFTYHAADGTQTDHPCRVVLCKSDPRAQESKIVMGHVPYPCDALNHAALGLPYRGYTVVAEVPIGMVEFAPSREALQLTPHTVRTIGGLKTAYKRGIVDAVQREINKADTAQAALRVIRDFRSVLGSNQPELFKWRNRTLPTLLKVPTKRGTDVYGRTGDVPAGRMFIVSRHGRSYKHRSAVSTIDIDYLTDAVFITDFDYADWTATLKKKLLQWLDKQPPAIQATQRFVVMDFPLPNGIIPPERIVNFATIRAEKLTRSVTSASSGRIPGSYDLYLGQTNPLKGKGPHAQHGIPGSKIDQTCPVYWTHGNPDHAAHLAVVLDYFETNYTIVCLSENRIAKFTREQPNFKKAEDVVQAYAKKALGALTADEKMALVQDSAGVRRVFAELAKHAVKLNDPALKEACRLSQISLDRILTMHRRFRYFVDVSPSTRYKNPLHSYLLFDIYKLLSHPEHIIRYLNCEYAHLERASRVPGQQKIHPSP